MNNRNKSGFCTAISQNFAVLLDFSAKLDIFQHIREYHLWNSGLFSSTIERKIARCKNWENPKQKNEFLFIFAKIVTSFLLKFWVLRRAEVDKSCRSRNMLQNEYLVAKIGVDTEENELSKVCRSKQAKTNPRSNFWLWELLVLQLNSVNAELTSSLSDLLFALR